MLYDAALKKAERLLRHNWASLQREAHRLAAEGLDVEVQGEDITLYSAGRSHDQDVFGITIRLNGDTCCHFGVYPDSGSGDDVKDVAAILSSYLKAAKVGAFTLQSVTEELAKH